MVQFDKSFVRRKKSQLCCTLIPVFALYKKVFVHEIYDAPASKTTMFQFWGFIDSWM